MWPASKPVLEQAPEPPRPMDDVTDTGEVAAGGRGTEQVEKPPVPAPPSRPGLQRNTFPSGFAATGTGLGGTNSQQQQQQQQQQSPAPTDSLSLLQLRRIVAEVNRAEPAAYDFVYSDMDAHAEEIDEWFVYQFWQWIRLSAAQKAFEWHWNQESDGQNSWDDADHDTRARFVRAAIAGVQSNDAALKSASIGKIVYLVLGRWGDTAMPNATDGLSRSIGSKSQLQAIKAGVECLTSLEGLPVIWEALRSRFELHWSGDIYQQASPQEAQEAQDELMNLMTIMYIAIQETLNDPQDMSSSYKALLELNPGLADFMLMATSKLRCDDQNSMPLTQIFLLFWKSILLVFGGLKDLAKIKAAMSETTGGLDKTTITASPLDYHVFRQEITSKYPAYVPPQPLLPLEDENASLLPPIPNQSTRNNGNNGIIATPGQSQIGGASILNQPVHIATPAPSPPPSPGVGGKSGKKQNYQTNQNFPFMYPPLDATSNSAGGKGMAGIDDSVVSRRWEGSDIPASILEAGELFSTRVRMTRATRQMWEEREKFLKFDRGWADADADADAGEDDYEIEDLDLNELTLEEREILREIRAEDRPKKSNAAQSHGEAEEVDFGPHPDQLSERDKQRLTAVERFYKESLPHLQSLVIVLLRPILGNVTAIVAQQSNQMSNGVVGRGNNSNAGTNSGPNGPRAPDLSGQIVAQEEPDPSPEEIDAARTREITSKATTGILLLLLKWLRLSHVLKFEYVTQLLLDSNYVPLVLKLFAHQDVQQVVDSKMDRVENSFFQFCNLRSKFKDRSDSDSENEGEGPGHAQGDGEQKPKESEQDSEQESEDEDDAVPPPIKRNRSPVAAAPAADEEEDEEEEEEEDDDEEEDDSEPGDDQGPTRPEVDELGYPVNAPPEEPITDFSWRNFFSLINYLRILQKICKNKAHRNLLLVQYKSSTILRKSLRVPQPELRLYTLKLFKNQVPYCGRKWRQSNMRVITAVYLHCRPELRDEWLAGSDVDAEVDSALPLEQALRGLTHWMNVTRYPDKIAPDIRLALRDEQDFFSRELEKLEKLEGGWADDRLDEMELEHVEGWA